MICLHSIRPVLTTQAVILLAFVLAAGFLLVILSCALWANWLPLLVGESENPYYPLNQTMMSCRLTKADQIAFTFVLAPLPNSIGARCARADELSPEYNSAYIDFGRFMTGMLIVSRALSLKLDTQSPTIKIG